MSVSSFLPQLDTLQPHGYTSSKWASEVFLEREVRDMESLSRYIGPLASALRAATGMVMKVAELIKVTLRHLEEMCWAVC
jgi:hypothetical protein